MKNRSFVLLYIRNVMYIFLLILENLYGFLMKWGEKLFIVFFLDFLLTFKIIWDFKKSLKNYNFLR